ncbi:hypothetical protein [Paractinoplanes rishiriensis]|uniref:DUF4386 family protein n=1 Tax=Paractinoplanes rishiriensis TaxID=1050105 RepID=A0A919JQR8_9ACTN|nr:hypothetical protein [Actinoplanes rishiriensis]GIE93028.1 hypothetical protein Ari01nite_04930 [Actinoplanes rishiriensis]
MLPQAKLGGLAALGFATTIVVANLIAIPAAPAFPGASAALTPLAWLCATVFGAAAVAVLGPSLWPLVGFAGLLLQNATFAGVIALRLALTESTTPALQAAHDALFTLNGTFLAVALLGLSLVSFVPRWQCTLGLTAAALLFTSATITPLAGDGVAMLGLVGWLLWVAWLVAYGWRLLQTPAPQPTAA